MTKKQIILFSSLAMTVATTMAGCGGSGDMEQAAPAMPERSGGAPPQNKVATKPSTVKPPPLSGNAAKRNFPPPGRSGRSPETEARKFD
jgi:hypothetical protein